MKIYRLIAFLIFLNAGPAFSVVHRVPSQYSTIQAAMNVSVSYDTVLVDPGIYYETVAFPVNRPGIVFMSSGGRDSTIIDAQYSGTALTLNSISQFPGYRSVIKGFTVRHGSPNGIYISDLDMRLEDLDVTENIYSGIYLASSNTFKKDFRLKNIRSTNNYIVDTLALGGGIMTNNIRITKTESEFSNNTLNSPVAASGGGGHFLSSEVFIDRTKACNNHLLFDPLNYVEGAGFVFADCDTIQLVNCLISKNEMHGNSNYSDGGAIKVSGGSRVFLMNHCTVADNFSGVMIWNSIVFSIIATITHNIEFRNSIIWSNSGASELGVHGGSFQVNNCDVKGYFASANSIHVDPQFIDTTSYSIAFSSPCVNLGMSGAIEDLNGNIRPQPSATNPDIGCYEIDQVDLAVHEIEDHSALFYPTLTSDKLNIKVYKQITDGSVIIYTSAGAKVRQYPLCQQILEGDILSIDIADLPSGIYIAKIFSGKAELGEGKILKQ